MEEGTKTGNVGNVNGASAYQQSFGMLPHGTVYSDSLGFKSMNVDMRDELKNTYEKGVEIAMKAQTTTAGGAGTAGYAMIPIYVDPQIVDRTRKETPLVELIPRVTNQGTTADYNVITAKGGAYARAEDAALTETDTTYDRASVGIKYLYAVGRVTGQAQAANPSYMMAGFNPSGYQAGFTAVNGPNAKQREVLVKARELKELEENMIINGNATTSGIAGNPNGTEFDGVIALQSTTNKVDKNTTAISLDDVNTAIQYAFDDGGRPNLAVCSSGVYTDLLNLIEAKVGYMNAQDTAEWGYTYLKLHTMVGVVPVIPSMYLSNVSGSKAIYFLDLAVWEMRVLQDMTFEDLAKTADSEKFMLKVYEALICRAPTFNGWVGEISG